MAAEFLDKRRTTGGGEKMAKKLNLGDSKLAFRKPNCQAMLPTEDKNLPEVVHIRRNSNIPKGVMMAVFWTTSRETVT